MKYIQNFQNEGFDIHICDVSSFFYSKDETQAYFNSTVSFYKPKLNNVTMIKNFDELKKHQELVHKDFFDFHEKEQKREPAPGDVTIF